MNPPKSRRARRRRKKNPLLLEYLNPPRRVVGKLPGSMEEIRYHRTGRHAGPYKHRFRSAANIYALADGSLWVRPKRRGKKLWIDLPE